MFGDGDAIMTKDWPEKKCKNCERMIRLVKTKSGWKPYEVGEFKPHICGSDVYDLPPERLRHIFNPRDSK